ncbi:MAG: ion transporter, partial [Methanocella sp.]
MYRKIKLTVFNLLDDSEKGNSANKVINYFLVALIVLNVLSVIFETVESFYNQYWAILSAFEVFSVEIFTLEYAARLWVCNLDKRYPGAVKGRLRYILSPMALIDLFAIVPFYLPLLIPLDMRFLRAMRLFRLFRLFKLSRYSESMAMFGRIARDRKEDLVITVFIVVIVLVLSSAMMYYAEHDAQPEKFDNIPDTMYWGIITLATVGYGDIYPITALGRFFSTIIALAGIALFALPAGIIGSSFIEERQKSREKAAEKTIKDDICPHCGKSMHEPVAEKSLEAAPLIKK